MMHKQAAIKIIAWKKLSRRSELLSKALDADLWFFPDSLPYIKATFKTMMKCIREKPKMIIIQLPQGPLILMAFFLKKILGCKIIADVHTGFLLSTNWKGKLLNAPFVKLLPRVDLILAHNQTQLELVSAKVKTKTIVVDDPWYLIGQLEQPRQQFSKEQYLVFPAAFAPDEPLKEVIQAVNTIEGNLKLYITGNWKRMPELKEYSSVRIDFTGYLPNEEFEQLIARATAIITGTKREYTSLMSGWEAIAYSKPLATTNTRTLQNLFGGYAEFYDYRNITSITNAINASLNPKSAKNYEKLKQQSIASLEKLKCKIQELN